MTKIEKIKRDILSKLKETDESEEDLYGSTLWDAIKKINKYTTIHDITEESELQSLYDILDNYGDNVEYINSKLEPTDSITDIFYKIKDYVDAEADEEAYVEDEEEEEEDRKGESSRPAVIARDRVEIVPFDESIHCERDENCNEVDITGILTPEEKNDKDMFTQCVFIYEPGRGLYEEPGSGNPNNLMLVTKFNESLLAAIADMPIEYEIQRIKYRIQKTNTKEFNQGLYLHREKRDLISFWVFQNINCSNTGTVIAKRVGDKAHITKIPDDKAFVVNDSIYAHKAPLDWDFSSPEYTRSILVAEIELNPRSYNKGREVVSHDLSNILFPVNTGLTIGGINRRRKTNKRKSSKRKTNKRKTNKRKTNKRKTNKRKTKKSRK
jgi:hypothetical protein